MIVKNEENNIERALIWAKLIAHEQIVVDTGSTDRTVEIAEKMGAKVYHFEWINDFSAAKNYAIEQATGNWIAFLDADEYFSAEDASKLIEKLKNIEENSKSFKRITILQTQIIQLNDDNEATSIDKQNRIFRNNGDLRFIGRIHEQITGHGDIVFIDDIEIIHTGYAETEYRTKNKASRNTEMLRAELATKPNDMTTKAYLANSLDSQNVLNGYKSPADIAEVDMLYGEVLECYDSENIPAFLKVKAYKHFLKKVLNDPEKYSQCEELCKKAYNEFPETLDFCYYYAGMLNITGDYKKAWEILKKAEQIILGSKVNSNKHGFVAGSSAEYESDPKAIYSQLLLAAQGLGDAENTLKYAALFLKSDKTNQDVLRPYIKALINSGKPMDEVLELLSGIYNIGAPSDLLLIAKAATACGATDFANIVIAIAQELMG